MNTEVLSGMSYILQTSDHDRGVQNESPESHFNTLWERKKKKKKLKEKKKPQKLLKLYFKSNCPYACSANFTAFKTNCYHKSHHLTRTKPA